METGACRATSLLVGNPSCPVEGMGQAGWLRAGAARLRRPMLDAADRRVRSKALSHAGCQPIHKLKYWVFGTNAPTVKRVGALAC